MIVAPENSEKQNPNESSTNKYEKHVDCSYDCKLIYVDDKFSKRFKSYLDEDALYYFVRSMIKESKYCSDVIKKI